MITLSVVAACSAYKILAGAFGPVIVTSLGCMLSSQREKLEDVKALEPVEVDRVSKKEARQTKDKLMCAEERLFNLDGRIRIKDEMVSQRDAKITAQSQAYRRMHDNMVTLDFENRLLRQQVADYERHSSRSLSIAGSTSSDLLPPYSPPATTTAVLTVAGIVKVDTWTSEWQLEELLEQVSRDGIKRQMRQHAKQAKKATKAQRRA